MFAGDPPNAVLSYSLPSQSQPLNIVLTLTNPQYDALRILQATDIPLDMNPDLAPFQRHKTPYKFGKAALLIDNVTMVYCPYFDRWEPVVGDDDPCYIGAI